MRAFPLALVAVTALFVACSSSTSGRGFAADTDGGEELDAATPSGDSATFGDATPAEAGACNESIDVVFVLDVSSSMDFVLDKLGTEIESVVMAANALAPDAHFGLVAFVDNHKLDTSGPLDQGKVHVAAATLKAAFQGYKTTYTSPNRNPGDGPGGPTLQNPICEENAPDALHAAAVDFPWRVNATHVVIAVTDDTFLEKPDNYGDRDHDGKTDKTDFPKEGNYPAAYTMTEAIDALRLAKTRVFSVTRLTPPGAFDLTRCGTGRRLPWAAISDGWSTPYAGAQPIPARTGGQNFDLEQVKSGKLSLGKTIESVVLSSHCNPPK